MPGWWGRRGSGVNVEDHSPASQRQRERQHQRRIVERHPQRRDEHRSTGHDADPAGCGTA
jgi:hypothetical protein